MDNQFEINRMYCVPAPVSRAACLRYTKNMGNVIIYPDIAIEGAL